MTGEVAVFNDKLEKIYHTFVYHDPKHITNLHCGITGFNRDTLNNGQRLEVVKREIQNLFTDAMVIGCALELQFSSLGLDYRNFMTIDLQSFYRKKSQYISGVSEPIGVRHLIAHYYSVDIFQNKQNASEVAYFIMRLYLEQYTREIKIKNITFDHIKRLPSLYVPPKRDYNKSSQNTKKVHFKT